jgi:L-rhamnose mutarotase
MQRICLALDLKNDAALIDAYEKYHNDVWPEVIASIVTSGITNMEIYRIGNRLFMIVEATDDFSFEKKAEIDKDNKKVQDWEDLMWIFQKALPGAKPGEKWMVMKKIFELNKL